MNLHNRWFQLGASLVAMIMIANLQYAWTLFVTPIQTSTNWKLSDIQFAFTLFILFQTWVQPLDGWLIDRLGPRGFISAAGLLCGLGWAGLGYATTLTQLFDRLGAQVVQGSPWSGVGHHGRRLRWRDGAVHPNHFESHQVGRIPEDLHRHWSRAGSGHSRRGTVPPASASGGGGGEARERCRISGGPPAVHDARNASDAAVLCVVRGIRAHGERRAARDRECGTDGQVMGPGDGPPIVSVARSR